MSRTGGDRARVAPSREERAPASRARSKDAGARSHASVMDSLLRSRLRASEGAYFKSEQERDLERLARERARKLRDGELARERMIEGEGVGTSDASRASSEARASGSEYAKSASAERGGVDKLASVYAEELRLPGTTNRARATVLRREVGNESVGSHEVWASGGGGRESVSIFDAHAGAKLNRRDWMRAVSADLKRAAEQRKSLSPMELRALEASHAAQRHALIGGVRALAYGTALCMVGVVGGSYAASSMLDVSTHAEFARKFKDTFEPYVERARSSASPYKSWVASDAVATDGVSTRVESIQNSRVVQKLRKKLGRREKDSGPW